MDLVIYSIPSTPMQIVKTKSKSLPGLHISLLFYFYFKPFGIWLFECSTKDALAKSLTGSCCCKDQHLIIFISDLSDIYSLWIKNLVAYLPQLLWTFFIWLFSSRNSTGSVVVLFSCPLHLTWKHSPSQKYHSKLSIPNYLLSYSDFAMDSWLPPSFDECRFNLLPAIHPSIPKCCCKKYSLLAVFLLRCPWTIFPYFVSRYRILA